VKRAFDRYNIFKEYPCENVNRFSKDGRSVFVCKHLDRLM